MNSKKNVSDSTSNIIGFGLAGAILSWQYYFRNINFKIFDSGENHSTRTAAGLVNPIVFKRLTKSWKADELVPYAADFYKRIEQELGVKLVSHRSIIRIFSSIEEQNNWATKCGDSRFENYIDKAEDIDIKGVDAPFGGGRVNTIGNLNTKLFLDKSKSFFLSNGIEFIESKFDYYSINNEETFVFCEGYEVKDNFFFNYLPLKPTQGETLTIKTDEIHFEEILNKNMFVLPLGGGIYKIGATYNWDITESDILVGEKELREKLSVFAKFNYEIINHEAGIRPTVADRRPLIGTHPEHENLHIFNGMGTKGVMIAPYYSNEFMMYLLDNHKLDKEVDIERYKKVYNV